MPIIFLDELDKINMVKPTKVTLYELIGGQLGVKKLVKVFYDLVETDPVGRLLLALHNVGHVT